MATPRPIVLTSHAIKRLKQRVGVKRSAARATAQRAFDEGLAHAGACGRLRRYFDQLYLRHGRANMIRIYGRHTYIFRGPTLITVLHLPHELESNLDRALNKP